MIDYLFNQNLLIATAAAAALLSLLYFQLLSKDVSTGSRTKYIFIVAGSILILCIEISIARHFFTLDNIPTAGYGICLLLNLLLLSFMLCRRMGKKTIVIGLAAIISAGLLLFSTVNIFYRYYPTIASIFGMNQITYARNARLTITNGTKPQENTTIEKQLNPEPTLRGTISNVSIPGSRSHFLARDAIVYRPAAYNTSSNKVRFPVLILLTGVPGSPVDWLRGEHFQQTMDDFAGRHDGVTPVVIIADHNSNFANDTECVDSSRGNVETYLTVDVPLYVASHFTVSSSAGNWAIGGLSEGGMCAAMLSLRHQSVYRHFLDMSGDPYPSLSPASQTLPILFNGSRQLQREHSIDWLLMNKPIAIDMTGQFLIGGNDNPALITKMRTTYSLAVKKGVSASFSIIPSESHNAQAWERGFREALPKLSAILGATNCESDCTK